ncbi:transposable element Tcb2 transposase [Trichonephila clavipes]|nr:transposable element Tcb2 transposase [Trichonephila clavipes]
MIFLQNLKNCSKKRPPAKLQASHHWRKEWRTLANTPVISRIPPATTAILATRASSESTGSKQDSSYGSRGAGEVSDVFSDEFRFNLSSGDNRVRVWRPCGERLNPAFALQRHTAPTAGVMLWGAIAYNTRSPLILIRGTMTAQRYVHDILQPHVLPLMQRLPGAIFQQDNDRLTWQRVSQECHRTVTTPHWPARSPDICLQSSVSEIIWDGELGIPRV